MGAKEKYSKTASMKQFLSKNPDVQAMIDNKTERTRFLELFTVHVARCKEAEKKVVVNSSITTEKKLHQTLGWFAEEAMDLKLGPEKAKHWRESDLLPTRPDRITGSRERYHIEYGCPEDYESYTETDLRQLKVRVEAELHEEDLEALRKSMTLGTNAAKNILMPGSSTDRPALPSTEATSATPQETDGQKMARLIESLKASRRATYMRYQDYQVKLKVFKTKAEAKEDLDKVLVAPFIEGLKQQIAKGVKLLKVLDRLLMETVEDSGLPKVIETMEDYDTKYQHNLHYAIRFGCAEEGDANPPATKRRKNKKDE